MSALLESLVAAVDAPVDGPIVVPDDSPYRIVLARLMRLVEYRASVTARLGTDPKAASELARVAAMVAEVHRAVSMNPDARALASRIDATA